MIKLIITDMDGTLLDDNKNLPKDFFTFIKKLQEQNIMLAIASGRQYSTLLHIFETIKDNTIFIAENGAFSVFKGKELFSNIMDSKDVKKFVNITADIPYAFPILCGKNTAFAKNTNPDIFLEEAKKYYHNLELVDNLLDVEEDIVKIAVCDLHTEKHNSYKSLEKLKDDFQIVLSADTWIDIMNNEVNKGIAIENIKKQLAISYDEIMVFGDYLNDYEMMSTAKYSFAMKNAHPKLKEISNFITEKTNNENGVIETIQNFIK